MTGSPEGNIEFMSRFSDAIKAEHPDAYLVGEAWTDYTEYVSYYQSGIDSFFNFLFAGKDGVIAKSVNGTSSRGAASYGYGQQLFYDKVMEDYGSMINDAPFLSNHDMGRASGFFLSSDGSQYKIAQAMCLLMSGNVFLYYGDEIGMSGSGRDENYRLAMYWTADDSSESAEIMCKGPADADSQEMRYPALDEQIEDEMSIYSFIRQTMIIRNSHPAICYGLPEYMEDLSGNDVCVIAKSYGDEDLLLIFNASESEQVLDLSSYGNLSVAGMLQTEDAAPSLEGNEAVMAPRSVPILSY
jgi:glycosidase